MNTSIKLAIVTCLIMTFSVVNAQLNEYRKFRFGLECSPNIGWINPETKEYEKFKNKLGFGYGLSLELYLAQNYAIATGFNITSVGSSVKFPGFYQNLDDYTYTQTDITQEYKLRYISVPVSLKMKTNEIGYVQYYGKFGLNMNFKYKSIADITYDDIINSSDEKLSITESDISNEISPINLALSIGGGVEYNISGNTSLLLGLSFNNGFTNVFDRNLLKLDDSNNVILDQNGIAEKDTRKAKGVLNHVSLHLGVFF